MPRTQPTSRSARNAHRLACAGIVCVIVTTVIAARYARGGEPVPAQSQQQQPIQPNSPEVTGASTPASTTNTAPETARPANMAANTAAKPAADASPRANPPWNPRLELKDLKRVESMTSDVTPLDAGMRQDTRALALPNNFRGLYQIPKDAATPYAGWFVRASGGVWAVFPQSIYGLDEDDNIKIVIPPNVHYVLGGVRLATDLTTRPPDADTRLNTQLNAMDSSAVQPDTRINTQLDARVDARADPKPMNSKTAAKPDAQARAEQQARALSAAGARIILDDLYRQRRLADLLETAGK